jgi:hypothetical protein
MATDLSTSRAHHGRHGPGKARPPGPTAPRALLPASQPVGDHGGDELVGCLDGVSAVAVDLVPGGISLVTVTSDAPLADAAVTAALDEAGDYRLSAS